MKQAICDYFIENHDFRLGSNIKMDSIRLFKVVKVCSNDFYAYSVEIMLHNNGIDLELCLPQKGNLKILFTYEDPVSFDHIEWLIAEFTKSCRTTFDEPNTNVDSLLVNSDRVQFEIIQSWGSRAGGWPIYGGRYSRGVRRLLKQEKT